MYDQNYSIFNLIEENVVKRRHYCDGKKLYCMFVGTKSTQNIYTLEIYLSN